MSRKPVPPDILAMRKFLLIIAPCTDARKRAAVQWLAEVIEVEIKSKAQAAPASDPR